MTSLLPRMSLIVLAACCLACPGSLSDKPPIHLNPNMDSQDKRDAQEADSFFPDGRAMRSRVEGTIPRGSLQADSHLYRGQLADGSWADTLPADLALSRELLERGRERYGIYCTPCHDAVGDGNGTAVQRGMLKPPSLHQDYLRAMSLGEFYEVIANGRRNMPGYKTQIPVADRWAIAAWVRTLQVSRNATFDDVPAEVAGEKGWSRP